MLHIPASLAPGESTCGRRNRLSDQNLEKCNLVRIVTTGQLISIKCCESICNVSNRTEHHLNFVEILCFPNYLTANVQIFWHCPKNMYKMVDVAL